MFVQMRSIAFVADEKDGVDKVPKRSSSERRLPRNDSLQFQLC
uniref:Uncharacterized protein n=1 Tax=Ascaris lumbricoides TaxID=6252 RepID=A0A0M3ILS9_ASCLU